MIPISFDRYIGLFASKCTSAKLHFSKHILKESRAALPSSLLSFGPDGDDAANVDVDDGAVDAL